MNIYDTLYELMIDAGLAGWPEQIVPHVKKKLSASSNSDLPGWLDIIDELKSFGTSEPFVKDDRLILGGSRHDGAELQQITRLLKKLSPWRKGPVWINGVHVDTEWRSDFKWQRVSPHISDLKDRLVLDVGCGNGYHCFRMAEQGAKLAIGVDPYLRSVAQFLAMNAVSQQQKAFVLPLGIEDLPDSVSVFDTVFSMGLLYHRRSPFDHLYDIKKLLRKGGEMVLETLVIEGEDGKVLVPDNRYAMMRNVWFIPTPQTLVQWVKRVGFTDVKIVDVTRTTTDEQRSTEWMPFDSLSDFLDPQNSQKTIEGYPAPVRAVLTASNG